MKLNTAQVSEKLGVSRSVVHRMLREGVLTDIKPRKEGAQKHYPQIDSVQITAYLKEHGRPRARQSFKPNGKPPVEQGHVPNTPMPTTAPVGPGVMSRLEEKLDRIETKLEALWRLWS